MPAILPAVFPWTFDLVATDRCEEGAALLAAQYLDRPRLHALLCAFLDSHSVLDQALDDVQSFVLNLTDGVGAQLDLCGRILGEPRAGQTDALYRLALLVRVLINRSDGTIPQLLTIFSLYEQTTVRVRETFPAAIEIEIDRDPIHAGQDVHVRARQSVAAGVDVRTITTPGTAGESLTFSWSDDVDQGPEDQALGWSGDTAIGGDAAWAQG